MSSLHPLELLPVVLYLTVLLFIGFRKKAGGNGDEDFIVGGRRLTLPAFVATLVTTWYGGILGVGEFTYLYGLSNWLVFGFPYYVFAILFAFLLAPRVQRSQLLSIPDQLYRHYGRTNGLIGTIYTFFMTLPAPYVLMVGLMLQIITGWALWVCVVLGTVFSLIYVISGGFRAVVRTDKLQFGLMFGGFTLILTALWRQYGGFSFLSENLPAAHLSLTGGNSFQYIVVWFFIALWTLIDPGFHQRCYAAKSPATARRGILVSVAFWLVFDFLTTTTGLYARALLSGIQPPLGFPLLSHQVLPPLFSGLFLAGLLATIMSTLDSNFLLSAITIGHDFWSRLKKNEKSSTAAIRIGLGITALVSIGAALLFPSVIQLWYLVGTLFIPPMLLPLLGCYFSVLQLDRFFTRLQFIFPFAASLIFLVQTIRISQSLTNLTYWLNIQPMYPGMAVALLIFFAGKMAARR